MFFNKPNGFKHLIYPAWMAKPPKAPPSASARESSALGTQVSPAFIAGRHSSHGFSPGITSFSCCKNYKPQVGTMGMILNDMIYIYDRVKHKLDKYPVFKWSLPNI